MTFPTIPTVGAGRVLVATQTGTSGTRTFPSLTGLTKNAGDRLVAICIAYQTGTGTDAAFSGWGGSFSEIADRATTTTMAVGIAEKISTGSETGTFTVTQAGAITGDACFILLSIPGAHASTPIEVSTKVNATGANAAPSALNPAGWATEETLWIQVLCSGETSTTSNYVGITAGSTNYTSFVKTGISQDAVGGVEGAVAFRQLSAASEQPAADQTIDLTQARNSVLLIAVRPAPAPNAGAGTGAIAWVGSATGTTVRSGAGTGTIGWVGTATGTTVRSGSGTGAVDWVGTATGVSVHSGSATGTIDWAGVATGARASLGSGVGTITWAGTATGTASLSGAASGAISWAGTATGARASQGAGAGAISWVGTAAGASVHSGAATGAVDWAGTADGQVPSAAISFGRTLGTGQINTSGTTVVITTTDVANVGEWIIVRVATDNVSATTPTFSCADSAGNTYLVDIQAARISFGGSRYRRSGHLRPGHFPTVGRRDDHYHPVRCHIRQSGRGTSVHQRRGAASIRNEQCQRSVHYSLGDSHHSRIRRPCHRSYRPRVPYCSFGL